MTAERGANTGPRKGSDGVDKDAVTRSEEELRTGVETTEAGEVRLVRHVDSEHVEELVSRSVERGEVERHDPAEGDSGQVETLPDGSVSVPVFEEQLVVEKRLVVRERIIIRKSVVTEDRLVEADLRKERVDVEADDPVRDRVRDVRD